VWVIAFYWWFRDHPSQMPSVNAAELELITRNAPKDTRGHSMPRAQWGQLFRSRSLWAMGIYYLCGSFGWSFFVSWMPDFYKDRLGVTYERSEWLSAAPLFFGGIACVLGGWVSQYLVRRTGQRWLGRAILPMIGCATAGVCMLLIPFARSPLQVAVLLTVTAFAFDLGQAANWATIVDIGGRYAGVTAGLINLIGNMGNAFQPYIGPLIIKHSGWNTLFGVFAVAYLISATMWLFIDPLHTFYDEKIAAEPDPSGSA
jgi:nitrate/nitrite transporter NarK